MQVRASSLWGGAVAGQTFRPAQGSRVLPPSDTDSADPVIPTRMQSSSIFECAGPCGNVSPGEDGTGLCPIGPTDELFCLWWQFRFRP